MDLGSAPGSEGPFLWMASGALLLGAAFWFWPHVLAAFCLLIGSALLTLGGVGWRTGQVTSRLADNALPVDESPTSETLAAASPDLDEVRRDLVANVSHELKTPLTAIRGYAETLQDGALEQPEVARRFTTRILEQCTRLEALLRDLLTLSWLEGDREGAEAQRVDLAVLLRSAAELLAPQAAERGVEIELDVEVGVAPCRGLSDELERMLLNLLENAIKYNRRGGVVRLQLRSDEERVLLEVEDTGIGIPPGDFDRVFERFYRVDKGRSRDQGGTGLGLAIVKHVVRGHGGEIEVRSRLGEGTCFRVWLPAASDSASVRMQP